VSQRPTTISALAAASGSSRDDLLRAAGALQLIPGNATKWARFERLLEVAAGAPTGEQQRPLTGRELRLLLTKEPIASASTISGEDPFEESFVGTITFFGGGHRVVAGGASGSHAGCQLVLDAVRSLPGAHENFRMSAFHDAHVLLRLSEAVCERAGLRRYDCPELSPRSELVVPDDPELRELLDVVTFGDAELLRLLGSGVDVDDLAAPGARALIDHEHESTTDDRSYLYPLERISDGRLVVGLPGGLAASITHRTLARAVDDGLVEPLTSALREVAQQTVARQLLRMRWTPIQPAAGAIAPTAAFSERFYAFDADKIAHVVCLADNLDNYRPGYPFEMMSGRQETTRLEERILEVRAAIGSTQSFANCLHLVVSAPLGRSQFLGFTHASHLDGSPILALRLDELEVVASTLAPDPVALWKFAVASDRLRTRSRTMSFSTLDEFSIYLDHGSGFYLGDDQPPTFMSVTPGSGASLVLRKRREDDRHAVQTPSGGSLEVKRWPADDASPVYRLADSPDSYVHVVELEIDCWVEPAPAEDSEQELSEDLAEATAFWIWRARSLITDALEQLRQSGRPHLTIRVRCEAQSAPHEERHTVDPTERWLKTVVDPSTDMVDVTLLDGALSRLWGPKNAGEVAYAASVAEAVRELARVSTEDCRLRLKGLGLDPATKMLNVFGGGDSIAAQFGYTARPRLVQDPDVEFVLDELGQALRADVGDTPRSIGPADRTPVLNRLVAGLFTKLRNEIEGLDSQELIEHLLQEQERLAFLDHRTDLLVPAQTACFGAESSAVADAIETRKALIATGPPSRFLLEMTTAIRPSGQGQLSLSKYDRLLALAKQIVELGYASDAIWHGLSDPEMSVLASGRLGISREGAYQSAIESFGQMLPQRALNRASAAYSTNWALPVQAEDEPFDPSRINAAFEAEFGLTATELAEISGELAELARNETGQVARRARTELVQELCLALDITPARVESALELLTLSALPDFPDPSDPADTFPWRFSRDRSAVRRPIAECGDLMGEVEVAWGPRAVFNAGRQLLAVILSGRLRARSAPMKAYITEQRQAQNLEFNRSVADVYRAANRFVVLENVRKLGSLRLERRPGEDIGDVDVLVIDPSKKVAVAIETKDFELARTPPELRNEVDKLLEGDSSALAHHKERLAFLRAHVPELLQVIDSRVDPAGWQIQGLIATSSDLVGLHYASALKQARGIEFVTYDQLADRKIGKLVARTKQNPNTKRSKQKRRRKR